MAIKSSGPLRLADLQAEFGGVAPLKLSMYYKGGALVPSGSVAPNVPTGGAIRLSNFYGAAKAVAKQIEFVTPGTFSFVVPSGVTSLCALCIGPGDGSTIASSVSLSTSNVVCLAGKNGRSIIGTGGYGGRGTSNGYVDYGGGGAGGYSSYGGTGAWYAPDNPYGSDSYVAQAGSGGGGGGGHLGCNGGGVGLLGQGANGGTQWNGDGLPGSGGSGALYGGGYPGQSGGDLAYKNAIAVSAGQTLTIVVGGPRAAVRLIWGAGRAYPSTNTGNL